MTNGSELSDSYNVSVDELRFPGQVGRLMLSLPQSITEAEIDALRLPPDLALIHVATHFAFQDALRLRSFGRYADPDDQRLSLFFGVIYSLHDHRLPAARNAIEPVRRELIEAHRDSRSGDFPTFAGVSGDCGHGAALALAEHILDCACLDEDDDECWQDATAVLRGNRQPRRRVIIANARYLPGGGRHAKAQWKCIRPRIAAVPAVDFNRLIALMRNEIVSAASRRQTMASLELSPWQIDQFRPFEKVLVPNLELPVDVPEEQIKRCFSKLLSELTKHGDWAGEKNDLLANCSINGQPRTAALLLKGPSVRKPMQIRDCGKNGDQILKLSGSPAQIFVIQHVHDIEESVRLDLYQKIQLLRKDGNPAQCCFIDGKSTASILYGAGIRW
jgi:hypothetical protein